jgi:hypothetical protein
VSRSAKTIGNKAEIRASATIGFRLDDNAKRILEERAALFDRSPHDLARQYVIESLMAGEEREQLRQVVSALQVQVAELRAEFAHAVRALLVSAGKVNPEHAEAWVEENFKQD